MIVNKCPDRRWSSHIFVLVSIILIKVAVIEVSTYSHFQF